MILNGKEVGENGWMSYFKKLAHDFSKADCHMTVSLRGLKVHFYGVSV